MQTLNHLLLWLRMWQFKWWHLAQAQSSIQLEYFGERKRNCLLFHSQIWCQAHQLTNCICNRWCSLLENLLKCFFPQKKVAKSLLQLNSVCVNELNSFQFVSLFHFSNVWQVMRVFYFSLSNFFFHSCYFGTEDKKEHFFHPHHLWRWG